MRDRIRAGITVALFVALVIHWKAAGQLARYHYQGRFRGAGRTTRRATRALHQARYASDVKVHQFSELVHPLGPSWDDTGFIRPPVMDRRFRALSRTRLTHDALNLVKELKPRRTRGQR